jgi:hypothetical protein
VNLGRLIESIAQPVMCYQHAYRRPLQVVLTKTVSPRYFDEVLLFAFCADLADCMMRPSLCDVAVHLFLSASVFDLLLLMWFQFAALMISIGAGLKSLDNLDENSMILSYVDLKSSSCVPDRGPYKCSSEHIL